MNFNNFFLKSFRVVLLPFAIIYGCIVIIRNRLYARKILSSATFNFPIICVGNLAVGGTGKSPMVEYLIRLLEKDFKIATLSRGYKRKTKGYTLANAQTTAIEIGDEPMQFHSKFPHIPVAVGEQRIEAIPQLLHDHPELQAIILDDAFQHRMVNAGFNILLTDYANLYIHDFFLPTGDLRDEWLSAKRAKVIIVTKCPPDLSEEKRLKIIRSLRPKPYQSVFFTTIAYETPYHIVNKTTRTLQKEDEVLLVCGIANPKPLKDYILQNVYTYYQKNYEDHHIFSIEDLNDIQKAFNDIDAHQKCIITTEKDGVRLQKYADLLADIPVYVLPITHRFLFNQSAQFNQLVVDYIHHFYEKKYEQQKED